MKRTVIAMAAAVLAVGLLGGCGKKEATTQAAPAPQDNQAAVAAEQQQQLKDVQAKAAQAAETTTADIQQAAAKVEGELKTAQSQFDAMVAEAKTLIDGKKYQDALTKLQAGLQTPDLTADQKSILQKLLEQVKAAMTTGAVQDVQNKAANALKGLGGK